MKNSELFKIHMQKRVPAIVLTVFLFTVFALYYIGVYDISFIERPESWKGNLEAFISVIRKDPPASDQGDPDDDIVPDDPANSEPEQTTPADPEPKPERPAGDSTEEFNFNTVSAMKQWGYRITDKVWNSEDCAFAILNTSFDLPKQLSYSEKTCDVEKVTTYEDGTESVCNIERTTAMRYALEMYMGYIIFDDMGKLYLIDSSGQVLCEYNDEEYIPAYTRDINGRPLFYKTYKYSVKYPTEKTKPDENGNSEWIKTDELKLEGKKYYYLSANGQYFIESDYNDATDNRGLYFDYPSYYGNSDNNIDRYCRNTTKIFTTLKGETTLQHSLRWMYSGTPVDLAKFEFDENGKNIATVGGPDLKQQFPYTMAYNYSEGYATVRCDIDWDYYHDITDDSGNKVQEYVKVTSNEVRIVDKTGKIMFDSRKNYYSDLGWTANERFEEPLRRSIASLGSYYFDHGYMRLRIQSYDRYYFTDLDTIFIVSDDDVLVNSSGKKFSIPSGYSLVSYSDGIMLLEKDGYYGYMNTSGVWVMKPDMKNAEPFLEGVAVCINSEGNYGVIATNGKVLIPFRYRYISNISSGTLVAYSETSGWTIFQKMTWN